MSIAQINGVDIKIYGYHYEGTQLIVDAVTLVTSKVLTYPAELVDVMLRRITNENNCKL